MLVWDTIKSITSIQCTGKAFLRAKQCHSHSTSSFVLQQFSPTVSRARRSFHPKSSFATKCSPNHTVSPFYYYRFHLWTSKFPYTKVGRINHLLPHPCFRFGIPATNAQVRDAVDCVTKKMGFARNLFLPFKHNTPSYSWIRAISSRHRDCINFSRPLR